MPRVSWIIPVLNGMPYLPEALASLENQTFKDFEVLVWDNGSTDGTVEMFRQWVPGRLPGRVFTGEPLSLGSSLRRLAELSQAPLIARMDADDVCLPHRLETQVRYLESHPQDALVASDRICIDETGREVPARSTYPQAPAEILHATLRAPRILHPTVVMRRDALMDCGNYLDLSSPACAYWSEDYDLWLRFLARHRAVCLPEKLLRYRYNPKGLTENEVRLQRAATARRAAWRANARDFAGIDSMAMADRLWERRLFLSLPVLNGIARHFSLRDGIPPAKRWRMESFQKAASSFIRKEDLISRAWLKLAASICHRASPLP
jgi:glycosyltransferase involved in cell wall biosynthesis